MKHLIPFTGIILNQGINIKQTLYNSMLNGNEGGSMAGVEMGEHLQVRAVRGH